MKLWGAAPQLWDLLFLSHSKKLGDDRPESKEDAKKRFTFLHVLLKDKVPQSYPLLKDTPAQIKDVCDKSGVRVIESKSSDDVREALLGLWG